MTKDVIERKLTSPAFHLELPLHSDPPQGVDQRHVGQARQLFTSVRKHPTSVDIFVFINTNDLESTMTYFYDHSKV